MSRFDHLIVESIRWIANRRTGSARVSPRWTGQSEKDPEQRCCDRDKDDHSEGEEDSCGEKPSSRTRAKDGGVGKGLMPLAHDQQRLYSCLSLPVVDWSVMMGWRSHVWGLDGQCFRGGADPPSPMMLLAAILWMQEELEQSVLEQYILSGER